MNNMDFKLISTTVKGSIGTITLDRPERSNACTTAMVEELRRAAEMMDRNHEVRAVIVNGNGKSFCAGFDLNEIAATPSREFARNVDRGRVLAEELSAMRPISIACVHGHCVGAGMVIAASCDLRYATPEAKFSLPEARLGAPLAWSGVPTLVAELGANIATEMILLCNMFSSQTLRERGFLNGVVAADELPAFAQDVAAELSSRPAVVLEVTKRQIRAARSILCQGATSLFDSYGFYMAHTDVEAAAIREGYVGKILNRPQE